MRNTQGDKSRPSLPPVFAEDATRINVASGICNMRLCGRAVKWLLSELAWAACQRLTKGSHMASFVGVGVRGQHAGPTSLNFAGQRDLVAEEKKKRKNMSASNERERM